MSWTSGEETDQQLQKKQQWVPGKYVKVIGSLRTFGGGRSVNANIIRLVEDHNQIMYHFLDAMKVTHEDGQKSGGDGAAAVGSMSMPMKMDVKPEQPVAPGMVGMGDAPPGTEGFTPQQQMVAKMIGAATSDSGCGIGDLESSLKAHGMMLSDIREACDYLSAEGHIYPTIDDDHFQLCTG